MNTNNNSQLFPSKMSNSNRPDNKSPNPKLARYLHRIEQLVGHRGRTPSPITSRINKPIKPNSLDHYLKYELTFKILCGFFDKNNKVYMRNFFNKLRSSQNSKVQKIYKFVPIQKTQCAHMIVDSGISTKMLVNVLKTKLKSHLKCGFDAIRNSLMVDSNIMSGGTGRSQTSNRSNMIHSIYQHNKRHMIELVLHNFVISREASAFHIIKTYCLKQRWQNQEKYILKNRQNVDTHLIVLKLKIMDKICNRIQTRHLYSSYGRIRSYSYESIISQDKHQHNLIRLQIICNNFWQQQKMELFQVLGKIKIMKKQKRIESSNKTLKQQLMKYQKQQANKSVIMLSTGINTVDDSSRIFEAINRMNVGLVSIIIRRKMDVIKILQKLNNKKIRLILKFVNIFEKKIIPKLSIGFQRLLENKISTELDLKSAKSAKMEKKDIKYVDWEAVASLNNMAKIFLRFLFQPFNNIKQFRLVSQNKKQSIRKIEYLSKLIIVRIGFQEVKKHNQSLQYLQLLEKERKQLARKSKQILLKTLSKIAISSIADSFIKVKYHKKKANVSKNSRKSDWMHDIQHFLEERDRFNKASLDKITKIQQLVLKNGVDDASEEGIRPVFSPTKNKNGTLFVK